MLILTRRTSEVLKICDEVEVAVLGVEGNQVRIGISAPRALPVHREEIYLRNQAGSPPAFAGQTKTREPLE